MHRARLGTFLAAVVAALPTLAMPAVLTALATVAPPARAQDQDHKEPLVGTWLLDVGKSTFSPKPGPKGQMRTYSIAAGVEKMTSRGISGDGKSTFVHYQARYDGKDYDIIGSTGGNKISLKRIDRLTSESSQKRDGKPVIVATRRISGDEKTLTVETKGSLPDGRMLDAIMVFHRN